MLPTAIALAIWQYVVPANMPYSVAFGPVILAMGIAAGIF